MPRRRMFIFAIWVAILVFWALPAVSEVFVDTAWVRALPGPCWEYPALALDDSGNAYVTGGSYVPDTTGYATVKYLPNGDTAWLRTYHGSGNWEWIASSVAVDASGNAYVTGGSNWSAGAGFVTVKYYSSGDTAWVRTYATCEQCWDSVAAVVVDHQGNVYVTGGSWGPDGGEYIAIKYYPNGDTAWVRKYRRCDGVHSPSALAVDTSGNVYVTGGTHEGDCPCGYATVKYSSEGEMIWARTYDGLSWYPCVALDIGVDHEGNVYVTGGLENSQTQGVDYVTIKYYPTGDAWVRYYDASGGYDGAYALALDTFGNVHVTGSSYTSPETGHDYTTIKYQADGDTAWIKTYNGPGNGGDGASAMTSDQRNNVYVTGSSWNGTDYDYATIKHDNSGNVLWKVRYNGSGNTEDHASAIAVDGTRSVYVAGCSSGSDKGHVLVKYVETGMRGDVNGDWLIDVADVVRLVNFLFRQGPPPIPFDAGDANCDGYVTVGDIVYLVNYLFRGGPPPCEP